MATRGPKPKSAGRPSPRRGPSCPPPPRHLSPGAGVAWKHVVKLLAAAGDLDRTDPTLVEAYAVNVDLMRRAQEAIDADGVTLRRGESILPHPACAILNAATMRVKAIITDFGLCPASSRAPAAREPAATASKWGDALNVVG